MKLVIAMVRPERCGIITESLSKDGYNAFTKWPVSGRGRQKGIQVGDVFYEEMAKIMLHVIVEDYEKDEVIDIIIRNGKGGKSGSSGDGRIFVTDINETYTISEE